MCQDQTDLISSKDLSLKKKKITLLLCIYSLILSYEKTIEIENHEELVKPVKDKRTIGTQTLMRESEAQTDPAALGEIERDGSFLEILELKEFSYGNGLPVTMYELELIAKAREKRAFNDALPPLSDEVRPICIT